MLLLADFPGELIGLLCLGCWALPLAVVGVPYAIARGVQTAWQMRGVGDDGLYCAKCKFDLRGGTDWACPECGARVDRRPSFELPRGGILIRGIDPPMTTAVHVMFYMLFGFVPAVCAVLILGVLLPINDQKEVSTNLLLSHPDIQGSVYAESGLMYFNATSERSWTGSARARSVSVWVQDQHIVEHRLTPESMSRFKQQVWSVLESGNAEHIQSRGRDAVREEFDEIIDALLALDRPAAEAGRAEFVVQDWYGYSSSSFHPLYTLFAVLVVIAVLALFARRGVRDSQRNADEFNRKVRVLHDRYAALIEQNRERMNRPVGG